MSKLTVATNYAETPTTLPDAYPLLMIPGWNGSGPGHWQTIWEGDHPRFERVEQTNWTRPSRNEWVDRIDQAMRSAERRTFVVAHSLGCIAVAHWAADAAEKQTEKLLGAFLVAPPWLTQSERCPTELQAFLPTPLGRLPFRAMLVASNNDPYLPIDVAARLAAAWGAHFVNVGRQGHINVASGHGRWKEGQRLLAEFVAEAMDGPV